MSHRRYTLGQLWGYCLSRHDYSIVNAGSPAQGVREGDRKFLDELAKSQDQHDSLRSDPAAKTYEINSGPTVVPRAELVVNSQTVRRAALVLRNKKEQRKRQEVAFSSP